MVYLDHSATTPTDPRVVRAMLPYMTERFWNPSSPYDAAREARTAVDEGRERVAAALGAQPDEIVFTSGGTEADNIAVAGVAHGNASRGRHVVTSAIEHHAVLRACEYLEERHGFEVTYLPVDRLGLVDPRDVEAALRNDTVLVSIMHSNNEIGTIEPIEEIATIVRERGIPLHTDAVQSVGRVDVDVERYGVDLLSLSGHKLYGPKGVGALYVRSGTILDPLSQGGTHEGGLRPGTENVPGIVGLAEAIEIALADLDETAERLRGLTARLERGIRDAVPDVSVNGHPEMRLPGTINLSCSFVEGESLVLALDLAGFAVSTGSACTTGESKPSHVITALGVPPELAQGSLRFSLGRENTADEVDRLIEVFPPIVERLRAISPLGRTARP